MDIFVILKLIGGICSFLFGMNVMGQALERRAGNKLRDVLSKMTTNPLAGFFTGCGVTCIVQSSAATAVMAVGFVNSSLMTLRQAINVIIGANVGTTITGWILSLSGISSDNVWMRLLKPESFTPIVALIGIICYMFCKKATTKDTGTILLGFAILMFGMETMSLAVTGDAVKDQIKNIFTFFDNPVLGLLIGVVVTAAIQSSSASVGILQAISLTGGIKYSAAIPIVIGAGIGSTITALISSVGAKKDAKRAAVVNVIYNVIGAAFWLIAYMIIDAIFHLTITNEAANPVGIAIVNTLFRLLSTVLLMPNTKLLEKIVCKIVPDSKTQEQMVVLDERLLDTPPLALQQCRRVACLMADKSVAAFSNALLSLDGYTDDLAQKIRDDENTCDYYEDILGTYLIKLSAEKMGDNDAGEATELLKIIGDFERISDHAVNILESAEEIRSKKLEFSNDAKQELKVLTDAANEITHLALDAFENNNVDAASFVEPLEQVIDGIKENMRTTHILRMQDGNCSIEAGFIWSDLLTNLERTSDHCSNIAGCVIDTAHHSLNLHESLRATKTDNDDYNEKFSAYAEKYSLKI